MSGKLKEKIKQTTDFADASEEAMLNLLTAADAVRAVIDRLCAAHNITAGQYNVLRILRGAGCNGHPRCEIAARMLERAPDITRLLDRLEKQELVWRACSIEDRRHSIARVSDKGLRLLDQMEAEVSRMRHEFAEKLSPVECVALIGICEKIYGEFDQASD